MMSLPLSTTAPLAMSVVLQGLALGLGLIVAIGAQNAFVLRRGLRREHVGSVVLFCALADALLICAGVMGMAQALGERPGRRACWRWPARSSAVYGLQARRRALQSHRLQAAAGGIGAGRGAVLARRRRSPCSIRTSISIRCCWSAAWARSSRRRCAAGSWRARAGQPALVRTAGLRRAPAGTVVRPAEGRQVLDALIGATMFALSALLVRHVVLGF